jgi:hypothetical protein
VSGRLVVWVLGVCYVPVSNAEYILDRYGKVFLGVEGACMGVVFESIPKVVDELNRFEGVGRGDVLGNIISLITLAPIYCSLDMVREVILGSVGDRGRLIVQGKGDL